MRNKKTMRKRKKIRGLRDFSQWKIRIREKEEKKKGLEEMEGEERRILVFGEWSIFFKTKSVQ